MNEENTNTNTNSLNMYIAVAQSKEDVSPTGRTRKPMVLPVQADTVEEAEELLAQLSKLQPALLLGFDAFSIMEVLEVRPVKTIDIPEPDIREVLKSMTEMFENADERKAGRL